MNIIWTAHFAVTKDGGLADAELVAFHEAFPPEVGVAVASGGDASAPLNVAATFTVEAADTAEAFSVAHSIFREALEKAGVSPWLNGRGEVVPAVFADAEMEQAGPELVGVREVAELLGVSKQRVDQLRQREDFPKPLARLASGPVWDALMLTHFLAGWERKSGRPPRELQLTITETVGLSDPPVDVTPVEPSARERRAVKDLRQAQTEAARVKRDAERLVRDAKRGTMRKVSPAPKRKPVAELPDMTFPTSLGWAVTVKVKRRDDGFTVLLDSNDDKPPAVIGGPFVTQAEAVMAASEYLRANGGQLLETPGARDADALIGKVRRSTS